MIEVALTIILGVGFLHAFYRAVAVQWPTSYFTLDTRLGYAITATPARYTAFRFLPVYLACLFAAVTLARLGESPIAGAVGIAALHAATTSGRALFSLWRGHESRRKAPLALVHIAVALGVACAALAAIVTRRALRALVPPVDELSTGLWTAVVAAVLGAYIVHLSRRTDDFTVSMSKSRHSISGKLWEKARADAVRHQADPELVHAIMLIENIQRPRWFRRLERLKGVFFRAGTYGIMQVQSSHPISDEESVERCVSERLNGVQVPLDDYGYPDGDFVRTVALRFNPEVVYADSVVQAYEFVRR